MKQHFAIFIPSVSSQSGGWKKRRVPGGKKRANIGCTCFGEVSQGAAEGAPLQALSHGVGVIQTGAVHAPVARFLLQARALRHAGPHHPLLLLQLSCGKEPRKDWGKWQWFFRHTLAREWLLCHVFSHLLATSCMPTIDLHKFQHPNRVCLNRIAFCPGKETALSLLLAILWTVKILPRKVPQLSNEDHALFLLYTAWGGQSKRGMGGDKKEAHTLFCISPSPGPRQSTRVGHLWTSCGPGGWAR